MSLTTYSIIAIAVAALCTFATRLVPFALFGGKKEVPATITYLGKVLPPAIIATLIIYCIRSVDFTASPHGAAEIIAIVVTALLHIWKKEHTYFHRRRNNTLYVPCSICFCVKPYP